MKINHSFLRLAVPLLVLLHATVAQVDPNDPNHGVRWVYPPRSEEFTFHYMDTVEVSWTSYFDEPLLYTFCTSDDGKIIRKSTMRQSNYSWARD